jgi:type I restriction enzyme S subunit
MTMILHGLFEGNHLLVSEGGANPLARSAPIAFFGSGRYWVNNHAPSQNFEPVATQRFVEFSLENINLDDDIAGAVQPNRNPKALYRRADGAISEIT